jgi:hypothetical protein
VAEEVYPLLWMLRGGRLPARHISAGRAPGVTPRHPPAPHQLHLEAAAPARPGVRLLGCGPPTPWLRPLPYFFPDPPCLGGLLAAPAPLGFGGLGVAAAPAWVTPPSRPPPGACLPQHPRAGVSSQ